jgi:hypothetical protein
MTYRVHGTNGNEVWDTRRRWNFQGRESSEAGAWWNVNFFGACRHHITLELLNLYPHAECVNGFYYGGYLGKNSDVTKVGDVDRNNAVIKTAFDNANAALTRENCWAAEHKLC